MKKYIFFIVIIFSYGCKSPKEINESSYSNKYKIIKIKEEDYLYQIYAKRNDSIFKIISSKENNVPNCNNSIRTGKKYDLQLICTHPPKEILGIPVAGDYHMTVRGIGYKSRVIYTERRSHYKLYKADNLEGLCIKE